MKTVSGTGSYCHENFVCTSCLSAFSPRVHLSYFLRQIQILSELWMDVVSCDHLCSLGVSDFLHSFCSKTKLTVVVFHHLLRRVCLQIQCFYLPPFSSSKEMDGLGVSGLYTKWFVFLCKCWTCLYIYIATIILLYSWFTWFWLSNSILACCFPATVWHDIWIERKCSQCQDDASVAVPPSQLQTIHSRPHMVSDQQSMNLRMCGWIHLGQ